MQFYLHRYCNMQRNLRFPSPCFADQSLACLFNPVILLQLLLVSGQCFLYTAYTQCYRIVTRHRMKTGSNLLIRNFIVFAKLPFAAITNQNL